jgi:hypothetical protein
MKIIQQKEFDDIALINDCEPVLKLLLTTGDLYQTAPDMFNPW